MISNQMSEIPSLFLSSPPFGNTWRSLASALIVLMVPLTGCGKKQETTAVVVPPSTVQVTATAGGSLTISTAKAVFQVLPSGYVKAALLENGTQVTLDDADANVSSDSIVVGDKEIQDFMMDLAHPATGESSARFGSRGKRIEIAGKSTMLPLLEKTLAIEVYDDFPTVLLTTVVYKKVGTGEVRIERAISQRHMLSAAVANQGVRPYEMWSFHGSSEAWGKDDVMPVTQKFSRQNAIQTVMHNDENRTGGGLPIVALWTRAVGESVGYAETLPQPMSLPVQTMTDGRVNVAIETDPKTVLHPGEVYSTPMMFVAVFRGDFFEPVSLYSKLLQQRGWSLARPTNADYEANWCGWGYEMDFTPKQMLGTIPKLKQLALRWATLDAGWFTNRGDWDPRPDTFPGDSLQRVVKRYHEEGLHLTLWWIPLVVEDGGGKDILNHRLYKLANVVRDHPDWLIFDKKGNPARVTAGLAALCPAVPEVRQYYKQLTERFIRDWDFDGHKLDFSYTVPACYNPKHHHKSPNDSVAAMGDVYKDILQTTRALKPESVTQACPCGTPPNMAWLPFIDQAVTADPVGAKQVRLRTKMYKALLGPESAVYGDHVELTDVQLRNTLQEVDKGRDFASEVGVGAVVGTKFTWPDYGPKFKILELTPEKETLWKKWIDLYNAKMLSRGKFLNLYTYGYDAPEAYAIAKDGRMYYAFYTPEKGQSWSGEIELRGLTPGRYQVNDYENGKSLGSLDSQNPKLKVSFREHLLLEASRQ